LQFFDLVSDQGHEPLAHDAADDGFVEELRRVIKTSPAC
jgi:hypothetical protein